MGQRILIVDDDLALLDALPRTLELRMPEIAVDTCDTASGALQRIARDDYDTIVTDIKMPGMDGLALLTEIHQLEPDTPTLLISGHGEHDLTVQALRGGAYDYIQKPIDRDYFVAALMRALHTKQLRRQVTAQRDALEAHARDLETVVAVRTQELVRATEAKDEFLGLISHEMRTPLTVITGGVHLLQRRKLSEEQVVEVLTDVEREGQRLLRIVEDLLALAHASLDDPNLSEPLSTRSLLETTVATLRARTGRDIRVSSNGLMPMVMGDPAYIERVVENLVSNSMKYGADDTEIEVLIGEHPSGKVLVTVRDHGDPIAPDEAQQIFERFYRSKSTALKVSGAGMGLTVCKRLVEALSGEIWATPREGGGLEVHFTLMRYQAGPAHEPSEDVSPPLPAPAPTRALA